MPAVRKPASTETAVQSCERVGVDSVLRADPRALPAHAQVLPARAPEVKRVWPLVFARFHAKAAILHASPV